MQKEAEETRGDSLGFFYATSDSFPRALFDGSILDPYGNLFHEEKLDEQGTDSMMPRKKVRDATALRYLKRIVTALPALPHGRACKESETPDDN